MNKVRIMNGADIGFTALNVEEKMLNFEYFKLDLISLLA